MILALDMLLPLFFGKWSVSVNVTLLLASGLAFIVAGVRGVIATRTGVTHGDCMKHLDTIDGPFERTVLIGFLIIAIHATLGLLAVHNESYYVATTVMSLCICATGLYGVCRGIIIEGAFILFYGISALSQSILMHTDLGLAISNLYVVVVSIVLGTMMILRHQYLPGVAAILFALSSLMVSDGLMLYGHMMTVVMAILLITYCIPRWLYKESGRVGLSRITDDFGRYRYYSDLGKLALAPTIGAFILGMMCFMISVSSYFEILHITTIPTDAIWVQTGLCTILVLIFAVATMWARLITESIMMMLLGVMHMIFFISGSTSGLIISNIFCITGLGTCVAVFLRKKQYWRFAACLALCVNIIIAGIQTELAGILIPMGYLIASVFFTLSGILKTYNVCVLKKTHRMDCTQIGQTAKEYAHTLVSTMGVLTFAILSLVLGYYVVDGDSSLYMVKFGLAIATLAFGMYALHHGIVTEGMLMYVVSMITIVTSFMHMFHLGHVELFSFIVSFALLPLAYRFFKEGEWMMSIVCVLLFVMFSVGYYVEDAAYLELLIAMIKAVSCIVAIASILHHETGSNILGRMIKKHGGHDTNHHAGMTASISGAHLTIGILATWCGANYIMMATGHYDYYDVYHHVRIAICTFALLFVPGLLSRGMLTEGMMSMYVAISSLAFSLSEVIFGESGAVELEMIFAISIGMTALMLLRKRCWMISFVAMTITLVYVIPPLTNTGPTIPLGLLALSAGIMLMIYSMLGIILGERGDEILFRMRDSLPTSGADYVVVLMTTVGMFTVSLLGLAGTLFEHSTPYALPGLFLAIVSSVFAIYGTFMGRPGLCLYILSMALPFAAMDVFELIYDLEENVPLLISGLTLFLASLPLRIGGFRIMSGIAMVIGPLMLLGAIAGIAVVCTLGLVLWSVMTLIYAINYWVKEELGKTLIPGLV